MESFHDKRFTLLQRSPGPCKRTQQFDQHYRSSASEAVSSSEDENEMVLSLMSDLREDYPIFRATPDWLITLFTVNYVFDQTGIDVRIWRHDGKASCTMADTHPMVCDRVNVVY